MAVPMPGIRSLCFLKNVTTNPNIVVGDDTILTTTTSRSLFPLRGDEGRSIILDCGWESGKAYSQEV